MNHRWNTFGIPSWSQLTVFGQNVVSKSAYVWLFIVPLTASVMSRVSPDVTVNLFGHSWNLALRLPFSWQLLFWASLSASAANLLFIWMCPKLIAKFPDFGAYRDTDGSSRTLRMALSEAYGHYRSRRYEGLEVEMAMILSRHFIFHEQDDALLKSLQRPNVSPDHARRSIDELLGSPTDFAPSRESETFSFVRAYCENCYPSARIVAASLYAISAVLACTIVCQNVRTVMLHSLK
jgi:hypothetical protein